MFKRLQSITLILESSLIGLFFIQGLRYLLGAFYSQFASASLVTSYTPDSIDPSIAGYVHPSTLSNAIIFLAVMIALPVVTILLGRWRFAPLIGSVLVLLGRIALSFPVENFSQLMASGLIIGGGLFYLNVIVQQRVRVFPYLFILGFAFDQVLRSFGNTLDPTIWINTLIFRWDILLIVLISIAGLTSLFNTFRSPAVEGEAQRDGTTIDPDRGILTIWGALGLGGVLFLEITLLALPNAIANRSQSDYTVFAPFLLLATLLPLIPWVRVQVRNFITPFDPTTRGWIWLILIVLLIVVATRIQRLTIPSVGVIPVGGVLMVMAQFATSLIWWWFARPRTSNERNFGGLWTIFTMLIFALLIVADVFTYEYAYVRDFAPPLTSLNSIIPPLLRGLRGLGLAVILLSAVFASLPMIQATRRMPLTGGKWQETTVTLLLLVGLVGITALAVRPPQVEAVVGVPSLRVGTYNIHAGYSEFFDFNLENIARNIEESGASIVLLQEVEAGRSTSYGVDQSLWLARRLGMDRRFFPTNEGITGLAVLSRVPIVFDDGVLLPSLDLQTGLQRVQVQPDPDINSVITIYNTWLGLLLQGAGLSDLETNQQRQLDSILGTINFHIANDYGGQLGRTILGGTFHNVPSSALIAQLNQTAFIDPFAGLPLELSATLDRTNLAPARMDYIWLWSQTLPPIGTNVMPSSASDHRLAVVEVQLRR